MTLTMRRILKALLCGSQNAPEIALAIDIPQATVNAALRRLRTTGFITLRIERHHISGIRVWRYSLNQPGTLAAHDMIQPGVPSTCPRTYPPIQFRRTIRS